MKKIILLSTLFSCVAFAQMPQGFDAKKMAQIEKEMQAMMANMGKVEQCLKSVDQPKMEKFGEKASRIEKEISQLCKQGERSIAQNKAISFSNEMKNNNELKKMKKCIPPFTSLMKTNPFDDMYNKYKVGKIHICDR